MTPTELYGSNSLTQVTRLLSAVERGQSQAAEELLPLVYEELRKVAAYLLAGEKPGQTLQATALVHEAYLRLVGPDRQWAGRSRFFRTAAQAMRRILIENARRKNCVRHGGGQERVPLDATVELPTAMPAEELLALGEALDRLRELHAEAAELIDLHFFVGLTLEQAGETLGLSRRTAYRQWKFAQAWLFREMHGGSEPAKEVGTHRLGESLN